MLSAGFTTNLAICCISAWIYAKGYSSQSIASGSILWLINALINGWLFAVSIYPSTVRTTLKSDGLSIYELFKASENSGSEEAENYQMTIAVALLARKNHRELKQFVKDCDNYQTSPLLLNLLSVAEYLDYNFAKYHEYSRKALNTIIEEPDRDKSRHEYIQAICQSNLAFAMYCTGSSDYEQMHELASQAFRHIPWESSIAGNYATILIRTEKNIAEGVATLEKMEKEEQKLKDQPIQRAMTYIALSEGYQKLNQMEDSKSALLKVRELDDKLLGLLDEAGLVEHTL